MTDTIDITDIKQMFYDRIEEEQQKYKSYSEFFREVIGLDKKATRVFASDFLSYKRKNRYPSYKMLQTLSIFFSVEEINTLKAYKTRKNSVVNQNLEKTIDFKIALAMFTDNIEKNLEEHNGSYKSMIRSLGKFNGNQVQNACNTIKDCLEKRMLPTTEFLDKCRGLFTKREYLTIIRPLESQIPSTENSLGLSDIELIELMTEDERQQQRHLREAERLRMIANNELL